MDKHKERAREIVAEARDSGFLRAGTPQPMINAITQALREAEAEALERAALHGIWQQAQDNHEKYSATGSVEDDIRFFALGLVGEAGEVANFIKKRWRDGDDHTENLRKECADVLAYTMMLASALGMTPETLVQMVAHKQQVFIEKMQSRAALKALDSGEG